MSPEQLGLLHPWESNPRHKLFGKNLSQARNFVMKLDAATATARSCHLHGHTQHTVASVTI